MTHIGHRFRGPCLSVCAVLLLAASALPASAASDDQNPNAPSFQPSADFMLGRPRVTVGLSGNWVKASAGSDLFDFVTDQLTIDRSDFNRPGFGIDLSINVAPRLDVTMGFEGSQMAKTSEYRDFVDNKLLPIEQTTSLKEQAFSAGVKFALLPAGRRVSRFAWIPNRFTPYVGAGGGMLRYDFEQFGDFVDFEDNHVFNSRFRSAGWTPSAYAAGGTDVHLFHRVFMSLEGRYTWSSATLDRDFVDFDPIDLKGFRFGAGFHYAF
jgi:opacity protein-like surface antigen